MNILLINSTSTQLDTSLVNYFLQNKKITFVTILHIHPGFNSPKSIYNNYKDLHKLKSFSCNGLDTSEVSSLLGSVLLDSKPLSLVIFVENSDYSQKLDFLSLSMDQLKNRVYNEFLLKIHFFQNLLQEVKLVDPPIHIIVIVPPYAQTKLINDDIEQAIIFSGSHMLTTAIADEFNLYGITCNGLVANESLLNTLEWFIFEKKDLETGKLFDNKKSIDW